MSNNEEKREYLDTVHLYLALQRPSKQGTVKKRCIRTVIKHDDDLDVFEAKIRAIGGEWRIYRTVNARSVEKAYKWFMKYMIDYPERASCVDSIWRTSLLQRECKVTKYFMLDIDTEDKHQLNVFETILEICENNFINGSDSTGDQLLVLDKIKSPSGWHYITEPFDTRDICKLDYVTLLRDGYYYVKTIEGENNGI